MLRCQRGSAVAAAELAANDYITCRVNSVALKNRLCDVETDCRDCLHVWPLRIVGALAAPTSMALTCRVEEPSTASGADICNAANAGLFDHLVGTQEEGFRDRQPDRLGSR